ncbi:MAG: NAD-dependent epimerase/dehydratase family protein [Pseudomonadota bacterium]
MSTATRSCAVDALVTGAGGFLGSALMRRLAADGLRVRALVRRPPQWIAQLPDVELVTGDLSDAHVVGKAVAGAAVVYHLGATTRGDRKAFQTGTVSATRNIVGACLACGTSRLVYASSIGVLDHAGKEPGSITNESSRYEPHPERRGHYTQAKLEAEHAVVEAMSALGLPAIILRPGQIFGPGAERVPPNGVFQFAGWNLVGNGEQSLPLVYVDDMVDALLLAGTRPGVIGQTFNIVDPAEVSQREYLQAVASQPGTGIAQRCLPFALMLVAATISEFAGFAFRCEVPLTRYRVRSMRPLANFDVAAASSILGWQPRVGVRAGMTRTFSGAPRASP